MYNRERISSKICARPNIATVFEFELIALNHFKNNNTLVPKLWGCYLGMDDFSHLTVPTFQIYNNREQALFKQITKGTMQCPNHLIYFIFLKRLNKYIPKVIFLTTNLFIYRPHEDLRKKMEKPKWSTSLPFSEIRQSAHTYWNPLP